MKGITKEELYNDLKDNHEVEFIYKNQIYVIQPEVDNDVEYLTIYGSKCLAKINIINNKISDDCIRKILNEKCIDGKSFNDIEEDVEVTVVY